jgi:hypothetical protein
VTGAICVSLDSYQTIGLYILHFLISIDLLSFYYVFFDISFVKGFVVGFPESDCGDRGVDKAQRPYSEQVISPFLASEFLREA